MALELRPLNVKDEVEYIIHGYNLYDPAENLFNGSMTAVYNGTYNGTSQRKTLPRTYWAAGTGSSLNYLDIEFLDDVRIWDAGGDAFPNQVSELNIYTNTDGRKGTLFGKLDSYTQQSYNNISPNWQAVAELPKGRYRIESDGSKVRISNEWYLEKLSSDVKTLILHDGEYKKRTPFTPKKTANLVPIMSSNTDNGITISASSEYSTGYMAYKAFDGVLSNNNKWLASSGSPQWIKVKFEEAKTVINYELSAPAPDQIANSWVLEGSNDDLTWYHLDTRTNTPLTLNSITSFDVKSPNSYLYYRITFNGANGTYISIDEIRLYELLTPTIEGEWLTVSSTTPTQEQFSSEGMDSLSPLLDRRVETLEPLSMIDKSEILQVGEEGKVFSKTISLKKYIDLRSIKVEVK